MQLKELSERSGYSLASIKFFLREGLLMPGEQLSATRARYSQEHLDRLQLIRVLRQVGDLPIARVHAVLQVLDDTSRPLHDVLSFAHHALGPERPPAPAPTDSPRTRPDQVGLDTDQIGPTPNWAGTLDPAAPAPPADAASPEPSGPEPSDAVPAMEPESVTDLVAAARAASTEVDPTDPVAARADVVEHLRAKGWNFDAEAPALDVLAAAMIAIRTLWFDVGPWIFEPYADLAMELARFELDAIDPSQGRAETVRSIIVGTVVFEQALIALRRLAQEHHSQRRFGAGNDHATET